MSYYHIQSIPLTDLAKQFGTPLYVYDANKIIEKISILRDSFKNVNLKIKYACKANTNLAILKLMRKHGVEIDVVSPEELRLAMMAGFEGSQITFTPSGVSFDEIELAAELGTRINLDNLDVRLFGNDLSELLHAIETSVRAKASIVARDETETGDRMLLNLGHTFGHALEAWAGYSDRLLHGEAVAIGMAQAFRFSEGRGLVAVGTAKRVEDHLAAVGLPTRISDVPGPDRPDVDTLIKLMQQDKKVQRGRMTFILVRGIGEAFIARDVEEPELRAFLARELKP